MVRAYKSHSEYSKQPGWTMINSSFDRNLFSDGETFDHSGRFYYHKFFFPNGDPCNRGRADMEGELLFLDQTHKCRSSFHVQSFHRYQLISEYSAMIGSPSFE
ncbi:hypothetical protein Y032_0669g1362 [Ancylostoma ceylanicum]|uniref:Uncharacterized protein n=1 Tax=Ancylostoma ceylanicum TaxID=53326 RepID=A0A016WJL2_9BILA|nr:hypothetical protein Y032_0669g1362 [Ancylostoma ceylanicum]